MTRHEAITILNTINNIINEAGEAVITIRTTSGNITTATPENIRAEDTFLLVVTTYGATYCAPYRNIESMSN